MEANNLPLVPSTAAIPVQQDRDSFFSKEAIDSTWTRSWDMVCPPVAASAHDSLTFNLPKLGQGNYYFLQDARIHVALRLLDKDGAPPAVDGSIAPVEDFASAIFSDVKVFFNETQANSNTAGMYPYHSYLNALLSYSAEKKQGSAMVQGFVGQNRADYNAKPKRPGEKSAFLRRRSMFGNYLDGAHFTYSDATSPPTSASAPLLTEFSSTNMPLISNVGVRIELSRASPNFYLMLDPELAADAVPAWEAALEEKKYKLLIDKIQIVVPVKTMNPSLDLKVEQRLAQKPLEYRTVRMEMSKKPIAKGLNTFSTTQLKQESVCPDRIYFMVVPDYQLNGAKGKNPFHFCSTIRAEDAAYFDDNRANLEEMRLSINNETLETYETSSTDETVLRKYLELDQAMGHGRTSNSSLTFNPEDYRELFFVMGYDLTAAKNAALLGPDIRGMNKEGAMRLDLRWSRVLPCDCWLVMLSEYHSMIKIDKNQSGMCQYLA